MSTNAGLGTTIIFGMARTDTLDAGFVRKRSGNAGSNNSVLKRFKTLTAPVFYQVKKSSRFALELLTLINTAFQTVKQIRYLIK